MTTASLMDLTIALDSSSLPDVPEGMNICTYQHVNATSPYKTLIKVKQAYFQAHPYVSMVICTYGVITNIVNILVLTKPNMRNSINCILTGIAIADIVTMSSYVPFAYFYYLMEPQVRVVSQSWNTFMAVYVNLTLISHTSSIWLGVLMAAMRYFFVRPTARGAKTLGCRSTMAIILVTFIGASILIVPNCITTGLTTCFNNTTKKIQYGLTVPSFNQKGKISLEKAAFFIYPVGGKIIPCTLISVFGGLLFHTLRETDKRSRRLKGESSTSGNGNSQTRRTTIMLLAIIALYILSELPQSILVLLCIFVNNFFTDVYNLLGDFIDLLSLVNSALNFVTYIAMSTQYRKTLAEMSCVWLNTISCHKFKNKNALQSTKYSMTSPTTV